MAGVNAREYGYRPGPKDIGRIVENVTRIKRFVCNSDVVVGDQDGMQIRRDQGGAQTKTGPINITPEPPVLPLESTIVGRAGRIVTIQFSDGNQDILPLQTASELDDRG